MGDKNPKSAHKQAAQKLVKADNIRRDKDAATAATTAATERNGKK